MALVAPYQAGFRGAVGPSSLRRIAAAVAVFVAVFGPTTCAAEERHPLEAADTSSPRATLDSFMDACNDVYRVMREEGGRRRVVATHETRAIADRIIRCLDLSEQPAYLRDDVGREAAVCLKEVLDRIPLPPDDKIPGGDQSQAGAEAELPDRWVIPPTEITIVRVNEGPRQGDYVFSAETVARATEFYERVKHLDYRKGASEGFYEWFLSEPRSPLAAALVHRLPNWARQRTGGQAVWQWVGLVLTAAVALTVMAVAYQAGQWRAEHFRRASVLRYCVTLAFPLAAMLVPLVARNFIADFLVISGTTLAMVRFSANVVFLLAVLIVLVGTSNRIAELIISSPRIHPKGIDAQFIRLACRALGIAGAVVVFLEGGKYLGIPLTTLLAGAGVGGLAIALGAQDTLRNLFGSMMIILDKPYRVGERIVVKGHDGVVEEIGLRSTKIRLLTGHQVAMPNEEMARSDIENIGRRPHIRRIGDITIPLDTPSDKVEKALEIVRRLLQNHEGMQPDFPPRVYFTEYNRDSLNLRMIYWYHPPNYWDFLAFSERLNLQIKREFEAVGVRFALPSTTTYLAARAGTPGPAQSTLETLSDRPAAAEQQSPDDSVP